MVTNVAASEALLTRREAAVYLKLAVQTLASWASNGRYNLPFMKVGRLVRYRRGDLDRWLASRSGSMHASADSTADAAGEPAAVGA